MRNSLLVLVICAICFVAGYGFAVLVYLEDEVEQQVASINDVSARIITNYSQPVTIHIIKEVPAPVYRSHSKNQENLLGSIRNSFVKEGVELLVDGIPMTDLVPLISRISGYQEDDIWRMQQPHNFAKNLATLRLRECTAGLDGIGAGEEYPRYGADTITYTVSDDVSKKVLFSLKTRPEKILSNIGGDEPVASNGDGDEQSRVIPGIVYANQFLQNNSSRIYANFRLPADYEYQDILVKWCQSTPTQRNIVFGPHKISLTRRLNYVWYETKDTEVGDYHVSIYSSEEQPRLIASDSYSIVADTE